MTPRHGRAAGVATRALLLLALAGAGSACGVAESLLPQRGDDALPADAVPPVVEVLAGIGPTGAYRVAVYRDTVNNVCVELRTPPSAGASCSPAASDLAAPSVSFEDRASWVVAGTGRREATEARVLLGDGSVVTTRDLSPPNPITGEMRFFVFGLPPAPRPVSLAVVDAEGAVLEEWPLD